MINWSLCFVLWIWWAGSALILPLLLKSDALSTTTPHWTNMIKSMLPFWLPTSRHCSTQIVKNPNYHLLPYRRFCFHVYYSCVYVFTLSGLQWPSCLNCSEFPSPPQLCLSPPSLPPSDLTPKQPFSLQSSPPTRSSVSPSSSSITPTATASPSYHLPILGVPLSFVILVMFLPLCFFYTGHPCHHLCIPCHPRSTLTRHSQEFEPSVPLPSPPLLLTPTPSATSWPPFPPPPHRKSKSYYHNQKAFIRSVILSEYSALCVCN